MDMSPVPNSWELASLFCKFLFYFGAASTLGGGISLVLYGDGRRSSVSRILVYQLIGGLIGFQAVLGNFLIQVGQINSRGISGAFDWTMAQILLDTPLGDLSLYRLVGFVLLIASSILLLRQVGQYSSAPGLNFYRRILLFNGFSFVLLALSFRYGGHVSVLSLPVQFLLAIHFIGFALWIGSLYPLSVLCRGSDIEQLQIVLRQFGDHAVYFVSALLFAGVLLVINLVHSPVELINTYYGRALLLKIFCVSVLLGIAALNKIRLVPALLQVNGVQAFRRSLSIEVGVATLLLLVTAYLSTVVGPMTHS